MLGWAIDLAAAVKRRAEEAREARRWRRLRGLGMVIGRNVLLLPSVWVDVSRGHHIAIGDGCGFGEECLILAHDAQMDEFLDAARIGRVTIRESCHLGARTIVLPGVEIGPRTIVGAGSVVSRSLPPETVCAGSPAAVVCSLEEYLAKHRARLETAPRFEYERYDIRRLDDERRAEMRSAVERGAAYIVGGRTAEERGRGGTRRVGS